MSMKQMSFFRAVSIVLAIRCGLTWEVIGRVSLVAILKSFENYKPDAYRWCLSGIRFIADCWLL